MQLNHDYLWVQVETWSADRPQRILHGRISLVDYSALLTGHAPTVVRLDDCQPSHCPSGPVQDLFLRSAHILSVEPLDQVA